MSGINNQNNFPYQNQSNQTRGDTPYSSMDINNNQSQNMNNQLNFSNQVNSNMSNNIRYTEAPNMRYQAPQMPQNLNQKDISRMTEFNKGQERPLWSYRETKYDEFKIPRDTEHITTTSITRIEPKKKEKDIPPKTDFDDWQKKDKIYFNNNKYQKVKVTKKLKNNEKTGQKRGPQDDYDHNNYNQNYNNNFNYDNNNNSQYNNNNIPYNDNNNKNQYNDNINPYNDNNNNNQYNDNINPYNDNNNQYNDSNNQYNNNINNNQYNDNDNDNNNQYNNNNNNYNDDSIDYNQKIDDNDLKNDNDNYEIDVDALADVDSAKNDQNEEEDDVGEYTPNLKGFNANNTPNNLNDNNINENLQKINLNNNLNNLNNQRNPRPSFVESTTQKVTDIIDQINTIPEPNLQSWNLVADYTP